MSSEEREAGERMITLLDLLTTEKLDTVDQTTTNPPPGNWWRVLKQRLRLSWCGASTWRHSEENNNVVVVEEGMNLAEALAVERELRSTAVAVAVAERERVSLMKLLEENIEEKDHEEEEEGEEKDRVCCVCMGRKKGAALIPCGHTYCRVCSTELWRDRGCCPLCNRPILDVLHIY